MKTTKNLTILSPTTGDFTPIDSLTAEEKAIAFIEAAYDAGINWAEGRDTDSSLTGEPTPPLHEMRELTAVLTRLLG